MRPTEATLKLALTQEVRKRERQKDTLKEHRQQHNRRNKGNRQTEKWNTGSATGKRQKKEKNEDQQKKKKY